MFPSDEPEADIRATFGLPNRRQRRAAVARSRSRNPGPPLAPPITVAALPSDPLRVVRRLDRATGLWSVVKRLNPWVKVARP